MAKRNRRERDRGTRDGARSPKKPTPPEPHSFEHPRYGTVPIIVDRSWQGEDGQTLTNYKCDPDYKPPLPRGAIRADVHRQQQLGGYDLPLYYYQDAGRVCSQCRRPFVFSAKEQRYWYETLGIPLHCTAVRCVQCRRQRRTVRALSERIGLARRQVEDSPKSATVQLDLAEALVRYRQSAGEGNMQQAVAAARKARRLSKQQSESYFWEALAQHAQGRLEIAKQLLETYLEIAKANSPRARQLRKEAKAVVTSVDALQSHGRKVRAAGLS